MTNYQQILRTISVFLVFCFAYTAAAADGRRKPKETARWMTRSYLSLGWSSAVPLWNTYKRTEGVSPVGAELSYQLRLNPHLTLGPDVHWQLFDAVSSDRHIDAGADTPSQINIWLERRFLCAALTFHYYILGRNTMLPYIGLGLGAMRVREKAGAVSSAGSDDLTEWHLLATPEIGMYLLHGRIPVWLAGRLFLGIPSVSKNNEKNSNGEMMLVLTLGITVPN